MNVKYKHENNYFPHWWAKNRLFIAARVIQAQPRLGLAARKVPIPKGIERAGRQALAIKNLLFSKSRGLLPGRMHQKSNSDINKAKTPFIAGCQEYPKKSTQQFKIRASEIQRLQFPDLG